MNMIKSLASLLISAVETVMCCVILDKSFNSSELQLSPLWWGSRLDYLNLPALCNFMLMLSFPWKLEKSTGSEVRQTAVNPPLPSIVSFCLSGPAKICLSGFGYVWKLTAVWLKGYFSCNKTLAVSRTLQWWQMDPAKTQGYSFQTPVAHLICFCR